MKQFTKKRILGLALFLMYPMGTLFAWPSWLSKEVLFGKKIEQTVKKETSKLQKSKAAEYAYKGATKVASTTGKLAVATFNKTAQFAYKNPKVSLALVAGGYAYYHKDEIKEKMKQLWQEYKKPLCWAAGIGLAGAAIYGAKRAHDLLTTPEAEQMRKETCALFQKLFDSKKNAAAGIAGGVAGAKTLADLSEQEFESLWQEVSEGIDEEATSILPSTTIEHFDEAWNDVSLAQSTIAPMSDNVAFDSVWNTVQKPMIADSVPVQKEELHTLVKSFADEFSGNKPDYFEYPERLPDMIDTPLVSMPVEKESSWVYEYNNTDWDTSADIKTSSSDESMNDREDFGKSDSESDESPDNGAIANAAQVVQISDTEAELPSVNLISLDRIKRILGHLGGTIIK